jgi:hypothetical protein
MYRLFTSPKKYLSLLSSHFVSATVVKYFDEGIATAVLLLLLLLLLLLF